MNLSDKCKDAISILNGYGALRIHQCVGREYVKIQIKLDNLQKLHNYRIVFCEYGDYNNIGNVYKNIIYDIQTDDRGKFDKLYIEKLSIPEIVGRGIILNTEKPIMGIIGYKECKN